MPRLLVASLAQAPPLGRRLWLTLGSIGVSALNLLFFAALWPHTPAARPWPLGLGWLVLRCNLSGGRICAAFGRPESRVPDSLKGLLIVGLAWRSRASERVLRR